MKASTDVEPLSGRSDLVPFPRRRPGWRQCALALLAICGLLSFRLRPLEFAHDSSAMHLQVLHSSHDKNQVLESIADELAVPIDTFRIQAPKIDSFANTLVTPVIDFQVATWCHNRPPPAS